MVFNPDLKQGQEITNEDLMTIFKCSNSGGIRKSKNTNTLVIISDHTLNIFEDYWEGDIFNYSGQGRTGDQSKDYRHNKDILETREGSNFQMFLFERYEKGKYVYQGEVFLADDPFKERQLDINGNERKVFIFPLKLKGYQNPYVFEKDVVTKKDELRKEETKDLSNDELKRRIESYKQRPSKKVITTQYDRNIYAVEAVKRIASGVCQLCGKEAPFYVNNDPYLEAHHIIWLSRGGPDEITNIVALCPNCHRKMHALNLEEDVKKLKDIASKHHL